MCSSDLWGWATGAVVRRAVAYRLGTHMAVSGGARAGVLCRANDLGAPGGDPPQRRGGAAAYTVPRGHSGADDDEDL